MKTAVTDEGKHINAGADAPQKACCPSCGVPVLLRSRRSMSGQVTYFWRHERGHEVPCRKRSSPVGRRVNHKEENKKDK